MKKRDLKKRKRENKIINTLLLGTTIIFLFLAFQYFIQRREIYSLKNEYTVLKRERKDLVDKISDLKNEISKSNDLEYIEKQAREKLGMIKKDEKIYSSKVPDTTESESEKETLE